MYIILSLASSEHRYRAF